MGTGVPGGFAGLMHFESLLEVVGDARVKGPVAAFQDIKRPFAGRFFGGARSFLFPLKPREHSLISGVHFHVTGYKATSHMRLRVSCGMSCGYLLNL